MHGRRRCAVVEGVQSSEVCSQRRCKVWLGVVHSSSVVLCMAQVVGGARWAVVICSGRNVDRW